MTIVFFMTLNFDVGEKLFVLVSGFPAVPFSPFNICSYHLLFKCYPILHQKNRLFFKINFSIRYGVKDSVKGSVSNIIWSEDFGNPDDSRNLPKPIFDTTLQCLIVSQLKVDIAALRYNFVVVTIRRCISVPGTTGVAIWTLPDAQLISAGV